MSSVTPLAPRCVIWFGQPSGFELERLADAGWSVRVAELAACGSIGLRGVNGVVVLADLRHGDEGTVEALGTLLLRYPGMPCLVLGCSDAAAMPLPVCESIACADGLVDMQGLLDALARIDGALPHDVPGRQPRRPTCRAWSAAVPPCSCCAPPFASTRRWICRY
jgi:hypothetical protein